MTDEAFTAVKEFVEDELRFATSHYNDSYLERRLASRMRRTDTDSYEGYLELLRSEPDEHAELLDAFSINVTGFFRNPDVWEGVRPLLRELTDADEVRAWSAACADGREPYSLSMLAHDDPRTDEGALSVLATDINEESLETARQGVYRSTRTIDIGDQLTFLSNYHRFVSQREDVFEIRDRIKEPITFQRHDLINDGGKSGFDIVFCRNLFIYIDNEYKRPILETIADSLRPGGYLIIGKAETIPPKLQSDFQAVDGRLRIYRRD